MTWPAAHHRLVRFIPIAFLRFFLICILLLAILFPCADTSISVYQNAANMLKSGDIGTFYNAMACLSIEILGRFNDGKPSAARQKSDTRKKQPVALTGTLIIPPIVARNTLVKIASHVGGDAMFRVPHYFDTGQCMPPGIGHELRYLFLTVLLSILVLPRCALPAPGMLQRSIP